MESALQHLLDPNILDSNWIQSARLVIKEFDSNTHYDNLQALPEMILSKMNSDDTEVLELLIPLSGLSIKEKGVPSVNLSLISESELDFKRNLIKILLYLPSKPDLITIFMSFLAEESHFHRLKLVLEYLWPFLELDILNNIDKLETDKIIFVLFTIWKKMDQSQLYTSHWFWKILCDGLSYTADSGTIKKSLYLLRNSNKDMLEIRDAKLWNEYFNVIETLDEKQVHIVSPILSKLLFFQKAFSKDMKWYFVIYRRLFRHQNLSLVDSSLNRFLRNHSLEDVGMDFYRKDLLPVLNTSKIYHSDRCTRESLIIFFEKCTTSLDSILSEIVSINNWAPIPLFFILYSVLKTMPKKLEYELSMETLNSVCEFCTDHLTCMYPILQTAIKTYFLEIIMGSKCTFPDTFSAIRGVVKVFFKMKILSPTSKRIWSTLKKWISHLPMGSVADDATERERVIFSLLQDNSEEYINNKCLLPLFETINRPYAPSTNDLETYILYLSVKKEKLTGQNYEQFSVLLRRRLDKIGNVEDLSEQFPTYLEAFHVLFNPNNQEQFLESLHSDYDFNHKIKKYIFMNFAASCSKSIRNLAKDFEKRMELQFPDLLSKDSQRDSSTSSRLWGALECNYLKSQWTILSLYQIEVKFDIIDSALTSLDIGGKEVMSPIAQYFINNLNTLKDANDLALNIHNRFLPQFKESVFCYQKNYMFKSLLEAFIELCFHPKMIFHLPAETAEIAVSLLKDSETISVITELLSNTLNKSIGLVPSEWALFLSKMLIYGPIFRKDIALSHEVCKMALDTIENHENEFDFPSIRSVGLKLAFQLSDKSLIIEYLWRQVVEEDVEARKRRHYENSFTHLKRNRAAQGILLLMDELTPESTLCLFSNLIQEVLNEDKTRQQQPSVRCLMEWIISRILILSHEQNVYFDELLVAYDIAKRSRLTVIPSFITIFTQFALHVPNRREQILEKICPWLMGQHFATRSCAQIGFSRIQPKSEAWSPISTCLEEVIRQGDENKNREKLLKDFYPNSLDAINNWNLRDILYEFPRLCGILEQEWLIDNLGSLIGKIAMDNKSSTWSFHSDSKPCYCSKCAPGVEKPKLDIVIKESDMLEDAQKKIVVPIEEEYEKEAKKCAHPKLILVASLIDRLPNLGGLCRTSEIFGVGTLVLNCLKSMEEKDFQNLSVTSQNWVNTLEVRRENLPDWLKLMKSEEGYNLIGIEQTAQSHNIYEYNFPEKTILVLGNEKEGVCPEVLRELDSTIEIPQFGLIRSFNVHVTGALVISEYVRQSITRKNSRLS